MAMDVDCMAGGVEAVAEAAAVGSVAVSVGGYLPSGPRAKLFLSRQYVTRKLTCYRRTAP